MEYKLAEKLKDAGFPQGEGMYSLQGEEPRYLTEDPIKWGNAYLPTLSELIEACGEGLSLLLKMDEGDWNAVGSNGSINLGKTPEEAVAKLWLALNTTKE